MHTVFCRLKGHLSNVGYIPRLDYCTVKKYQMNHNCDSSGIRIGLPLDHDPDDNDDVAIADHESAVARQSASFRLLQRAMAASDDDDDGQDEGGGEGGQAPVQGELSMSAARQHGYVSYFQIFCDFVLFLCARCIAGLNSHKLLEIPGQMPHKLQVHKIFT